MMSLVSCGLLINQSSYSRFSIMALKDVHPRVPTHYVKPMGEFYSFKIFLKNEILHLLSMPSRNPKRKYGVIWQTSEKIDFEVYIDFNREQPEALFLATIFFEFR